MSAKWRDVAAVLIASWPGPTASWGEVGIAGYISELRSRGLAPEDAIDRLRASDSEFPPAVGRLVSSGGPVRATTEEALALLEQATRRVGRSIYAEDFAERHQAAVDWLAERDPVVAAYAARKGLCGPGSFGTEEIHSVEHGGAVRHRLAGEVDEVYRQADERVARGLPAVEPRMLLVRDSGAHSGGMTDLLDRLRPVAQLDAGTSDDDVSIRPDGAA
jgi:hypothetical protein